MKALNAQERRLAALARSVRAAIAVPSLFALALLVIKQPELAGFAVFGTFAHQTMVDYDTAGRVRFVQSARLTILGAIMVSIGTLVSASVWLASSGAVLAGFLAELPPLASGRIAAIRNALLLSFMLAVAVPAPAHSVYPNLAGWLIAGIVAQLALLVIWIPLAAGEDTGCHESVANSVATADRPTWVGNAVGSGMAMGLAILLTRLLKVEHAFWIVLGVFPVLSANARSAARTFWQEQAGTLIGFLISAFVVEIMGPHQARYWLILPFVVFGSTYAASAIGFMAGQAAFTIFAVVLFCILLPQQGDAGILRVQDIGIGGAVSLVVGLLRHLGRVDSWSACGQVRCSRTAD
jgi:Fusaric acid resistance protein-like